MNQPAVADGMTNLPLSAPGMRIGLFGGSFNPVHEGHRLVAEESLKRLALDALWMLVTPGNPLKDRTALPPLADRVRAARAFVTHPRIEATGFEAAHGFTYTFETVSFLRNTLGDRRLVWIMGADSFRDFHLWERWRDLADLVPIAVYARPGAHANATTGVAGTALARHRIDEADADTLATAAPPAWVYLSGVTSPQSSTALRAKLKP